MRLLKYLFIFSLFISFHTFADWGGKNGERLTSPSAACQTYTFAGYTFHRSQLFTGTTYVCDYKDTNTGTISADKVRVYEIAPICPEKNYPYSLTVANGSPIPTRICQANGSYFCSYSRDANSVIINTNWGQQVTLKSDSNIATKTCKNSYEGQCDKTDPYGGCYTPPNDGCTRQKDGSIVCPDNSPPPQADNTCNGATYCKRPPTGCGAGYVSGTFNGQQLCVKSGPSTPTDPNQPTDPNPNQCTASYCNKDKDHDCPATYYPTTLDGQTICVKDNPTPNKPNPYDPNNTNNNNPPAASEPSNSTVNLQPLIDAINALKSVLLQAIDSVSKKITSLVDGQKKTNQTLEKSDKHLENIEKSSQASSDSLGESNEHLKKIEEATQAVSESTAQTNEKLDDVKDAIEGQYKCNNNSYNPNDPHSSKYRECTESDLPFPNSSTPSDTNIDIGDIPVGDYESNYVSWSAQCPPDNHVSINLMGQSSTLVLSWSPWCELLSKIRWAIIACAYFAAAYIILGMR